MIIVPRPLPVFQCNQNWEWPGDEAIALPEEVCQGQQGQLNMKSGCGLGTRLIVGSNGLHS